MSSKKKIKHKQLKMISPETLLEEAKRTRVVFNSAITIIVVVIILIIWSAFAEVDEVSVSYGHLVPRERVKIIQHYEGGIVNRIHVKNGDKVKKNQLLIELSKESANADLQQLRSREITLTLDSERLSAFINDQKPDTFSWSNKVIKSKYNTVQNAKQIKSLISGQLNLLKFQYKSLKDRADTLSKSIEQRKEKLIELKNRLEVWKRHLKLLTEEFNMYHSLREKKYVSHKDYLTLLRHLNTTKGDGEKLYSEIEQTKEAILESEHKLNSLYSTEKKSALKERAETDSELLEVRHKIQKLEERISRASIYSSINGVVKGLEVQVHSVVSRGGKLLEVVPEGQEFVVESEVQPRDIGHIKVGDKASIKVLTYDYARYGLIHGAIKSISATTFVEKDDDKPYYKAIITLDKQYLGNASRKYKLKSGMTVEVSIITGKKTLMEYLLKPIHRIRDRAFHER